MEQSPDKQAEPVTPETEVLRPPYRASTALFFGTFALFFVGAAVLLSKNNWLAGVLAAFSGAWAFKAWHAGLYLGPSEVKIVTPSRLSPRKISWDDIEKFEGRFAVGESPVTLIRSTDRQPIPVPTFPTPRRKAPGPEFTRYRARVQAQVDDLNALLEQHRR